MWQMNTYWFDVAVVMSIFAFGNICFGHFEEHRPKPCRVLKVVIALAVFFGVAMTAGRAWAYGVLVLPLLVAAYIHLRWLPKTAASMVGGWTGEPKDKYLALVTQRRKSSI